MTPVKHASNRIEFDRSNDGILRIIDQIEKRQTVLDFATPFEIASPNTSFNPFPVEEFISIRTHELTCSTSGLVIVRDQDATPVKQVRASESVTFPAEEYVLEFAAPVTYYVEFAAAFEISITPDAAEVTFPEETTVGIGARSSHNQPATTIETSPAPVDLMSAIAGFGTALKTLSPERSFPTLRGHPPLLQLTEHPGGRTAPDPPCPSVELIARPSLADIYTLAPLVFYLGADLVPGDSPALRIEGSPIVDFSSFKSLAAGVRRILLHVFTLDCVVRTAGLYPVDLREEEVLTNQLSMDIDALHHQALPQRVANYLQYPLEPVASVAPRLPFRVHMDTTPERATMLPHLVNQLAVIEAYPEADEKLNGVPSRSVRPTRTGDVWGIDALSGPSISEQPFPIEQGWAGPGILRGFSKLIESGYRNGLANEPSSGDISIAIVCNDPLLARESDIIQDLYRTSSPVPFDVMVYEELTTGELTELLSLETDFLHYIGHVEDGGIVCTDGMLDLCGIDSTGVKIFLLNACNSFNHGCTLIEKGATAGIVTLGDVMDESAAWIGITLGKLLNLGYPLNSALSIVRPESILGDDYSVVGDGQARLAQASSAPALIDLETRGTDVEVEYVVLGKNQSGIGGLVSANSSKYDQFSLTYKTTTWHNPDEETVKKLLSIEKIPVRHNGVLKWSTEIDTIT